MSIKVYLPIIYFRLFLKIVYPTIYLNQSLFTYLYPYIFKVILKTLASSFIYLLEFICTLLHISSQVIFLYYKPLSLYRYISFKIFSFSRLTFYFKRSNFLIKYKYSFILSPNKVLLNIVFIFNYINFI